VVEQLTNDLKFEGSIPGAADSWREKYKYPLVWPTAVANALEHSTTDPEIKSLNSDIGTEE
jgi:hypothetical protein